MAALAAELQQLWAEHTSLVAAQQAAQAQTRRELADAVTALHDKMVGACFVWNAKLNALTSHNPVRDGA